MTVSWMKTGKESANLAKQQEEEAKKRKEEQGKMWRFWLTPGEEAKVTFVDGELTEQGFLLPARWYEHNLFLNGQWNNYFVCPEKTDPESGEKCPICEDQDRPYLAAGFTVIDHREFTGKDNKVYKDRRKLLVAKPQSFEQLNKLAIKLKGLAGQTFDISRSKGDKAPAIGDLFIPMEKRSVEECQKLYVQEQLDIKTNKKTVTTVFVPADYQSEIVYRNSQALRQMGFGKHGGVMGHYEQKAQDEGPKADYSSQL